jgi:putative SOS response-associated peptidase YedK
LEEMVWGIKPSWAGEKSTILINARSESVREKRSFKNSFKQRRCLIPADGFYEWTRTTPKKPHLFLVNDGEPFAIGAFWENDDEVNRCCLLTTKANAVLEPIHNRMPVIVGRENWDEWFADGDLEDAAFLRITAPYAADEMKAVEVSSIVNSARVDDARCCEPLPPTLGI